LRSADAGAVRARAAARQRAAGEGVAGRRRPRRARLGSPLPPLLRDHRQRRRLPGDPRDLPRTCLRARVRRRVPGRGGHRGGADRPRARARGNGARHGDGAAAHGERAGMRRLGRGYWPLIIALAGVWGASYLFVKVGVDGGFSPGALMFLRSAIAGLLLLGYAFATLGMRSTVERLREGWRQ